MKRKFYLLVLGLAILSSACTKYPPDSERVMEDLVVFTQYDTKVNFSDYKTYVIADNVFKVTDKDTVVLDNTLAQSTLTEIDKQMKLRGFVPAENAATADLGIAVVYYQDVNVYAYYGGWWGYYGWGYYYPYYYPPVYYGSYTTGLAYISAVDLKNPGNNVLYLRWTAGIRGLLTGGHTTDEVMGAVDQAFTQTPQFVTK